MHVFALGSTADESISNRFTQGKQRLCLYSPKSLQVLDGGGVKRNRANASRRLGLLELQGLRAQRAQYVYLALDCIEIAPPKSTCLAAPEPSEQAQSECG